MVDLYEELVPIPRAARFPIELRPPEGFRAEDQTTWPCVTGRLEFVQGRLVYMPPCGALQRTVAIDLGRVLGTWVLAHPDFVAGGNEAGMVLDGEVRAADAAVWRRRDLGSLDHHYARTAPVLAVEVAGLDELEPTLREKARWYLERGVAVVWLVLPESREVLVLSAAAESRHAAGDRLPSIAALPELEVPVRELFRQVDG